MPSTLATMSGVPAAAAAVSSPLGELVDARRARTTRAAPRRRRPAVRAPRPFADCHSGDLDDRQLRAARLGVDPGALDPALDLERLEVGSVLVERLLDRQLERRRRRRAAVAAAREPDPRHAVLQRDQLDVAAVATPCRAGRSPAPRPPAPRARPGRGRGSASGWRRRRRRRAAPRSSAVDLALLDEAVEDPPQPLAVEVEDDADQLLGAAPRERVLDPLEARRQLLEPLDQRLWRRPVDDSALANQHIPVGVCWTLRTLPAPLYMCTPHGRHGSKLRTARMMSTPLKFSGPFSSKIGVFCTASS